MFTRNLCSVAALIRDPLRPSPISFLTDSQRKQVVEAGSIAGATIERAIVRGIMVHIITGLALVLVSALLFWRLLPRNGECHRLLRTIWAPYISIGFTAGFAVGIAMMVSGVVQLFA